MNKVRMIEIPLVNIHDKIKTAEGTLDSWCPVNRCPSTFWIFASYANVLWIIIVWVMQLAVRYRIISVWVDSLDNRCLDNSVSF